MVFLTSHVLYTTAVTLSTAWCGPSLCIPTFRAQKKVVFEADAQPFYFYDHSDLTTIFTHSYDDGKIAAPRSVFLARHHNES